MDPSVYFFSCTFRYNQPFAFEHQSILEGQLFSNSFWKEVFVLWLAFSYGSLEFFHEWVRFSSSANDVLCRLGHREVLDHVDTL